MSIRVTVLKFHRVYIPDASELPRFLECQLALMTRQRVGDHFKCY